MYSTCFTTELFSDRYKVSKMSAATSDSLNPREICLCFLLVEPECQIPTRLHFFGVYDGHGCSHVATSCKQRLHQVVKEEIENGCKEGSDLKWESIMEKSFSRVDKEVTEWNSSSTTSSLLLNASCRCGLQTPKCDTVGSTAAVSVVTPDKIIVSNCGDSRAVLCHGGKAVALSIEACLRDQKI